MDAYKLLENKEIPDPIDEGYFDQLKINFRRDYLNLKKYDERIELHRNPVEVKTGVLHELYAYLQEICYRSEMRDIDLERKTGSYVPNRVKEIWEADKRLQSLFDAINKYHAGKEIPFNVIAVHMAEYLAMSDLADEISKDIYQNAPEPPAAIKIWDIPAAEKLLNAAFEQNSELLLLDVLKKNSFLFYELYGRKFAIQPVFHEINFGAKLRCDFAWLNDNSDGPEWVLVEVEKPRMKIFSRNGKPAAELNDAIEQVKSWDRYFKENPSEKRRIFGAVSRFKFILVAGDRESWLSEKAIKWRTHNNAETNIEIRSTDVFTTALGLLKTSPNGFWSFEENPFSIPFAALENYWQTYGYMDFWRKILN